ncbi:MAG: DNA mismatch repair protein MutS [Kofleriaceae bacterium]|nr:DNA mismatch repair protein MutS [Kofleriaceae bacterium]
MRQFLEVKERYPEAIVFFRLGDFYEMFFEDAVVAAKLLELTLTTRDKGQADAVPMCGVPHHAARGYIARLTERGYRVVICEQVEDPKLAKGLVRRDVVRVVTPGVQLDDEALQPKTAAYLAALAPSPSALAGAGPIGLAYLDATTGEFRCSELRGWVELEGELARIAPREVLIEATLAGGPGGGAEAGAAGKGRGQGGLARLGAVRAGSVAAWTEVEAMSGDAAAAVLARAGLAQPVAGPAAARAAGLALDYAVRTQPTGRLPITTLESCAVDGTMGLDPTAIANLELVETLMGRQRQGSLLAVLDETVTAPGGRCLRRWLLYPLLDPATIGRRHDAVAALVGAAAARAELRRALADVYDLERLAGKATLGVMTPRDLGRLRDSLASLPAIAAHVVGLGLATPLLDPAPLLAPALAELHAALAAALVDAPPAISKDGGVIRPGFDPTIDECRLLADGGKDAILAIEARERADSGIASLKVRYNRVFGYYIEITKSHLGKVPGHYVRKQTVAGAERYVTPELADLERKVLTAEETALAREAELVRGLVASVADQAATILRGAHRLAEIDVVAALGEVAHQRGYVRPLVDDSAVIDIVDGRHPVVETLLPAGAFVGNDARLDPDREQLLLITGPNMAGKSTYMRQVAHIVLLAQMGSFVPARSARIGVCDRLYTRVGAADNLARGDSTFMVEMRETAAILAGATRRSLIVLDEVGRGTSTYDGVSIAWAVAEDLHDRIGARTLFATHYHELVALAASRPRVVNLSVAVREQRGEIVFLRQVVPGAASRSYGIDVARLAGLPPSVISRARAILGKLEGAGLAAPATAQLSLVPRAGVAEVGPDPVPEVPEGMGTTASEITGRLSAIDPDQMTPLAALQLLAELRRMAGPPS